MAAWLVGLLLLAPSLEADLQAALERSRASPRAVSAAVGRVGEPPLFLLNADTPRAPGSNQKLLTAAAALRLLGRDAFLETTVAQGPAGELVVIGGGDPNLSGRFFDGDPTRILRHLAGSVAAKGVREVAGDLVLDASRFDDEWVHPLWPGDQLDRWYCAPVAALIYNDSCWDVRVLPADQVGEAARLEIQPSLIKPALLNRCLTVATRKEHVVHLGRPPEGDIEVSGGILKGSSGVDGSITVRNPVLFFGEAFRAALLAEGITLRGGLRVGRVEGAHPLVVYRSSLKSVLPVMLARSQNLYAECLFKLLGEGSFTGGGAAVGRALREMGIDPAGVTAIDGSGLANANRVSARVLYRVLQAMAEEPAFVESLATGGTGTLEDRYRDLQGRLRAKTGTIRGVTALSGYVTGRDGGRRVFSILANGDTRGVRAFQDAVVRRLAEEP